MERIVRAEGLRELEKSGGVALLMTDVVMPEINGPELAQRVKALRPDIEPTHRGTHNAIVHVERLRR